MAQEQSCDAAGTVYGSGMSSEDGVDIFKSEFHDVTLSSAATEEWTQRIASEPIPGKRNFQIQLCPYFQAIQHDRAPANSTSLNQAFGKNLQSHVKNHVRGILFWFFIRTTGKAILFRCMSLWTNHPVPNLESW